MLCDRKKSERVQTGERPTTLEKSPLLCANFIPQLLEESDENDPHDDRINDVLTNDTSSMNSLEISLKFQGISKTYDISYTK